MKPYEHIEIMRLKKRLSPMILSTIRDGIEAVPIRYKNWKGCPLYIGDFKVLYSLENEIGGFTFGKDLNQKYNTVNIRYGRIIELRAYFMQLHIFPENIGTLTEL